MFLALGLTSVLFGVFILFYMPDTPMSAKFLTNDEKVALLEHIKVNQTGIENKHFHPSQLLEGILDIGCQFTLFFSSLFFPLAQIPQAKWRGMNQAGYYT